MRVRRVLISGAGIGGPSLAFWLLRAGAEVTLVERAPSLRKGGQAVDFRGPAHMAVIERMGIVDAIRASQTHMGKVAFIDRAGKTVVELPPAFLSGELEIPRGDLSRILYDSTSRAAEYVFGDTITALRQEGDSVDVCFERASPRSFDLVVGADGLHSIVRALAFGDEARFLRFHDHYVAGFSLSTELGLARAREAVIYSEPGRGVSYSNAGPGQPARVLFVFRSPRLEDPPRDVAAQKALVASTFSDAGWCVPSLLVALADADDVYFDSISSVNVPHYCSGRIALLGDAGYGGTLGGQGTGLAMVGAYVLAGELAVASELAVALQRYEERLRPYAKKCQGGLKHVGPFYAPATRARHWMRDAMYEALSSRPLKRVLLALTTRAARGIELESYAM